MRCVCCNQEFTRRKGSPKVRSAEDEFICDSCLDSFDLDNQYDEHLQSDIQEIVYKSITPARFIE